MDLEEIVQGMNVGDYRFTEYLSHRIITGLCNAITALVSK